MNIVFGIIGIILSLLIIIYRVQIRGFMGTIEWAERHLGSGGTYSALLLFGIFLFFASITVMTGGFDLFFGDFLQRIFGGVK